MKLFLRGVAAFLLLVGGSWLWFAAFTALDQSRDRQERMVSAQGHLATGIPPALLGLGLSGYLYRQQRRQRQQALRNHFFRLLRQGGGYITVLGFAMEAHLSAERAKAYLDERAIEFNATFEVTQAGGMVYCFSDSPLNPAALSAALTGEAFDVVLEAIAPGAKNKVTRTLQRLTGLRWKAVKGLMQQTPIAVRQGVDRATAERFKAELEAAGATVLLVLQ